jgi:hypothetical protein
MASITAAHGAIAVASSSWVETRAMVVSTAPASTAPISTSVARLCRSRSPNVYAEPPGDQTRTAWPASANSCANRWAM